MLSFFRRGIWAKLMLVILGIGLFAIVITGFGTGGIGGLGAIGGGGNNVASVDGRAITDAEVSEEIQRQLRRARQQQPTLDTAGFLAGGALEETIKQLITVATHLAFASDQGITASKAMVDKIILSGQIFQNAAGAFDDAAFRRYLQSEGISEAKLREDISTSLIERQLIVPVIIAPRIPDSIVSRYAALSLEHRAGIAGIVPPALMGPGTEPTDAEIAAFYRTNQARYTIPERRVVRYFPFGVEQVAAQAQATDAEIAEAYRRNAAAYASREMRKLSQVVLPDEGAARAFAAKLAGGMSFAAAAAQAGYGPADTALPEQDKAAFARTSAPAVANAAFAAAKGATTAPVKSPLGWHIVRVDEVKTIPGRTLEAARGEIAAQIQQVKEQDLLTAMITRIENAVNNGASLAEVARAEKLAIIETPAVTAQGAAPDAPDYVASPELRTLLENAFDLTEEDDPLVEQVVPNRRFALVGVARVIPAAAPPLAQIRERVKSDLVAKRQLDRAKSVAAALVAKINAGTAPATAFAQSDIRLPPVTPIDAVRRVVFAPGSRPPPAHATLFSLTPGKARLVAAPQGAGWIVVYLGTITPGDPRATPDAVQQTQRELLQSVSEEYAEQFTHAIEAGVKVKRNDKRIAELKQRLLQGRQ